MDPENDDLIKNLDEFKSEDDIFGTYTPNDIDDEDDEDYLVDEKSLEEFNPEEEEESEEEEEEFFPEEQEEEEEEETDEFNEKELEVLNKKLGTDFKSVEDLKKSFNKQDKEDEDEKENNEYKLLTNRVGLFERYIGMDNEELIRNQMLSEASNEKKDITDQDVLDEIEERIEGLKDLKQLDSMAETLRANLVNQKEKTQLSIDKIDNKRTEKKNEEARRNTDNLQNALTNIFSKKEFMGVTVTKEIIQDAYQDIRTNKFFERVNNDQEMIAKLAIFLKLETEISKVANRPTHSENTKVAFHSLLGNNKEQRRSLAQAKGSASSGGPNENLSSWLK